MSSFSQFFSWSEIVKMLKHLSMGKIPGQFLMSSNTLMSNRFPKNDQKADSNTTPNKARVFNLHDKLQGLVDTTWKSHH